MFNSGKQLRIYTNYMKCKLYFKNKESNRGLSGSQQCVCSICVPITLEQSINLLWNNHNCDVEIIVLKWSVKLLWNNHDCDAETFIL